MRSFYILMQLIGVKGNLKFKVVLEDRNGNESFTIGTMLMKSKLPAVCVLKLIYKNVARM